MCTFDKKAHLKAKKQIINLENTFKLTKRVEIYLNICDNFFLIFFTNIC